MNRESEASPPGAGAINWLARGEGPEEQSLCDWRALLCLPWQQKATSGRLKTLTWTNRKFKTPFKTTNEQTIKFPDTPAITR